MAHLAEIGSLLAQRFPAAGRTSAIAIDGPSGAGKTDLSAELAAELGAQVLHLDDLYGGWHGLEAGPAQARTVLEAFSVDEAAVIGHWDWAADVPGSTSVVWPSRLLIIEGVGAGARSLRPYLSGLIWLDAPASLRKKRALARDGGTYAPWWDVWAGDERAHFAREGTQRAADLLIQTG
jgi:uridine kinase